MNAEQFAIILLTFYAAVAIFSVTWQSLRCPSGPLIWWLYVLNRLTCGLYWNVRAFDADGHPARSPFAREPSALIVANHRGPADPIVLWYQHHLSAIACKDRASQWIRPISFLMAQEIYNIKSLNWFFRAMRAIPVNRGGQDTAAVRTALKQLKSPALVGIFPEGGINHNPPGLKQANPGVAFLALSTDAPTYPIFIEGAPTGKTMLRAIFKPAHVRLIYGAPIDLSQFRGQKKTPDLLRKVTDHIMRALASLGNVSYEASTPEPTAIAGHIPRIHQDSIEQIRQHQARPLKASGE